VTYSVPPELVDLQRVRERCPRCFVDGRPLPAVATMPLYLELLGGLIPLGGERRFREEFRRITGRTAAEVMTAPAATVQEDTPIDDVASQLTEPGGDPVIVVRQDRLVGLITGAHLVRLVVVEETSG
jgi:CBS domain-containing protein